MDGLWTLTDWTAIAWLITIPLSFIAVTIPGFFIQKHLNGDTAGRAIAVSTFLGALAAVPTPITGTVVGTIALGFAGLRFLRHRA